MSPVPVPVSIPNENEEFESELSIAGGLQLSSPLEPEPEPKSFPEEELKSVQLIKKFLADNPALIAVKPYEEKPKDWEILEGSLKVVEIVKDFENRIQSSNGSGRSTPLLNSKSLSAPHSGRSTPFSRTLSSAPSSSSRPVSRLLDFEEDNNSIHLQEMKTSLLNLGYLNEQLPIHGGDKDHSGSDENENQEGDVDDMDNMETETYFPQITFDDDEDPTATATSEDIFNKIEEPSKSFKALVYLLGTLSLGMAAFYTLVTNEIELNDVINTINSVYVGSAEIFSSSGKDN